MLPLNSSYLPRVPSLLHYRLKIHNEQGPLFHYGTFAVTQTHALRKRASERQDSLYENEALSVCVCVCCRWLLTTERLKELKVHPLPSPSLEHLPVGSQCPEVEVDVKRDLLASQRLADGGQTVA